MAEAREIERMVADARTAVSAAATLDVALEALASLLSERFTVSRISVRTYDPRTDEIEIAGVWTAGPTQLGAGIRVPARSTSFSEVERRGSAMIWRPPGFAEPLLDQIVRSEGNLSSLAMPLASDGIVAGLLAVSSPDLEAFTEADLPFFDALADEVGGRLLLLTSS